MTDSDACSVCGLDDERLHLVSSAETGEFYAFCEHCLAIERSGWMWTVCPLGDTEDDE